MMACREIAAECGRRRHDNHNHVASLTACDYLKASTVVDDLKGARPEIAAQRASRAVSLDRIRDMVRREPPDRHGLLYEHYPTTWPQHWTAQDFLPPSGHVAVT